jgi:hypothetical protein
MIKKIGEGNVKRNGCMVYAIKRNVIPRDTLFSCRGSVGTAGLRDRKRGKPDCIRLVLTSDS